MYFSMVVKKYYLSLFTLSPMILVPHNTKFPLDYLFFVTHKLDKPKNDLHFKGKQTPKVDRQNAYVYESFEDEKLPSLQLSGKHPF